MNTNHPLPWTNERILRELFWQILEDVHKVAQNTELFREDALDDNPRRLYDRLMHFQLGLLDTLCSYLDGSRGPTDWPGVMLVNAETGEPLSDDFRSALSRIEGEFIDYADPWIQEPTLTEEDQERLTAVLKETSSNAGFEQSLARLLNNWAVLVNTVEEVYDDSIYEYTNDLSARDLLAEIGAALSETGRAQLERLLNPWDQRFKNATYPTQVPAFFRTDDNRPWWWHRLPIRMGDELFNDLISEGITTESMRLDFYKDLITRYLQGTMTAEQFQLAYQAEFKQEKGGMDRELFLILQDLFEDVDAYWPLWSEEEESPTQLTEKSLRMEVITALQQLEVYQQR